VKITTTDSGTEETQRLTVYGRIESEPVPYGRGRRWRPTRLSATFERSRYGDDPWGPWAQRSAFWAGVSVRADGTDGVDRSAQLWTDLHSNEPGVTEAAAWIKSVTPADEENGS
jgi:hypothetical protein